MRFVVYGGRRHRRLRRGRSAPRGSPGHAGSPGCEPGPDPRPAGSTWQSVQRGLDSTETDSLNGEICVLGREHGVPTPMNELLQRLIREVNGDRERIAAYRESEILAMAG